MGIGTDQNEEKIDETYSLVEIKPKNNFDGREELVDHLYNQLVNEIKEFLFPQRPGIDQYLDMSDPTSCYASAAKLAFNWFGSTGLNKKLAFESIKGISPDFSVLDIYLKEIIEEIMKNESSFINNILTPIQRDPIEMLRLLQTSDIGNYSHFDTYDPIYPVLGVEIYLEVERQKEFQKYSLVEESPRSESSSLVTECEHIHNKMLFDCINESLNQFRPYGKEGVPMVWSTKLRKLREDEILEFSKMFEIIKQDLFRWNYTAAGTMPKREFVHEDGGFDENYFSDVREKRLAAMLATDVMETEFRWVNYDFEEAQVKMDV
jgi:hypothetical protein